MSLPSPWNLNIVKHKSATIKITSIVPSSSSRFLIRNACKYSEECSNNSLFPPSNQVCFFSFYCFVVVLLIESISSWRYIFQSVAAIVFGDGSPTTLYPLTKRRSEAAIPIAGNYRLIDAVVSNCINSNVSKIYALTQFNSTSLNSHLSRAYSGVFLGKNGFVEVLAACQTPEDKGWFQVIFCFFQESLFSVSILLVLPLMIVSFFLFRELLML